jgi:hypothetical protein
MGQAIVYCSKCSAQLRGADFESGRAFRVADLSVCRKCYREVVGHEPPAIAKPPTPAVKPTPPTSRSNATTRIGIVPPSAAPAPKNTAIYAIFAAVGIVVLGIFLAMAFSGGSGEYPAPRPTSSVSEPRPAPAVAQPSTKELAAQGILARALRTEDLAVRKALLIEAVAEAAGTPLAKDAQMELDRVERKLQALVKREPLKAAEPAPAVPPEAVPAKAPSPFPASPASEASKAEAARTARWEAAIAPATARDYAAAMTALEKLGDAAPDLPILRSVSLLHQEAVQALKLTAKAQKIALEFRDESGAIRKVEAPFVEEENGRVELRGDSGSVEIPLGEILPSSLADLVRGRKGSVDEAAAIAFCLLEGDLAGAGRQAGGKSGTIPERYWSYARSSATAEDPARTLYLEALALSNRFERAADAVPKYQTLLRDHADRLFVRRNKAFLGAKLQRCARDFLFVAADLKPAGGFKPAKNSKGSACWTCEADMDPAKKDTYLDLSFSVPPDTSYRCWIYAGGCCQEVFEFSVQGSELKAGKEKEPAEPDSALAATIKPAISGLKKTHAGHTGPKQPSRWEWVEIKLPKYQKPGLERIRVLTAQKGFSVAYACVTSIRSSPPREPELKELEKSRGTPVAGPATGEHVLFALTLDGKDRNLLGELRDKSLYGVRESGQCWAGRDGIETAFVMPAQGELRVTYFLKTVTLLVARLRAVRGDKTLPYDARVAAPVAGRPTELRIPLSEFKVPYDGPQPPLAAGDLVPMIYLYGDDLGCGLRLDALSVVEMGGASKLVFSETFDNGPGRFKGGDVVDGGMRGTKALSMSPAGIEVFGAWSVPVKEGVTISLKLKPLGDLSRMVILVWSDKLQDNARYFIEGLRKGEWNELHIKATDLRIGAMREGPVIDQVTNIKIYLQGAPPETRVLLDDFEIRE